MSWTTRAQSRWRSHDQMSVYTRTDPGWSRTVPAQIAVSVPTLASAITHRIDTDSAMPFATDHTTGMDMS